MRPGSPSPAGRPLASLPAILRGLLLLGLPLVVAGLAAGACAPQTGQDEEADAGPVASYSVRGEIIALPADDPSGMVHIRHEPVPDFVDDTGAVVGMDAMTMPFPVADGVSLAGIEVGDPVRFDLEVQWRGSPPYRVAAVEELPADTVLAFEQPVDGAADDPTDDPTDEAPGPSPDDHRDDDHRQHADDGTGG